MNRPARFGIVAMRPRDPDEDHRVASPLELFFDLVFVVAVSLSSAELHHAEAEAHIGAGLVSYLMVFFAVWWAWMNFSWFASAFDTDDWAYRVVTFVQMAGALVLAAGTRPAMAEGDLRAIVAGYVVMRLALVTQWLRAAAGSPDYRRTALRYAVGVTAAQVAWVASLLLAGGMAPPVFVVLVLLELLVPVWAESARVTPWHPEHIAERYGLFTLILLGESVLASTTAIVDALQTGRHLADLAQVAGCGLAMAAGMWWIYFSHLHHGHRATLGTALAFGYGHYFIFAAAGAFSAGIEVAIDRDTGGTGLGPAAAAATLTVPVAVFILGKWWLTLRPGLPSGRSIAVAVLGALIGLAALLPESLIWAAVGVVAVVVVLEWPGVRAEDA